MELSTERLRLRPPRPEDAGAIQRMISEREVAWMLGSVPFPDPAGGAMEWIARTTPGVQFILERRDDGEVLGDVSIVRDEVHRRGDLGYWIGCEHWGQGYLPEAVSASVDYGFDRLRLGERVDVRVYGLLRDEWSARRS